MGTRLQGPETQKSATIEKPNTFSVRLGNSDQAQIYQTKQPKEWLFFLRFSVLSLRSLERKDLDDWTFTDIFLYLALQQQESPLIISKHVVWKHLITGFTFQTQKSPIGVLARQATRPGCTLPFALWQLRWAPATHATLNKQKMGVSVSQQSASTAGDQIARPSTVDIGHTGENLHLLNGLGTPLCLLKELEKVAGLLRVLPP